jgi:hypothetical protein
MSQPSDEERDATRASEIEESDTALTASQAETVTSRAETAASRLETAASRVETQSARSETQAAQQSAKMDSATVQEMIGEFTRQAEAIAAGSREAQDEWVAAVAAENVIFKKRNEVLVKGNRTIVRLLKVLLPITVLLLAGLVFLTARAIWVTGPAISRADQSAQQAEEDSADTKEILTEQLKTVQGELDDAVYIITQQGLPSITYMQDRLKFYGEDVRVVLQAGEPPFAPPTSVPPEE